MPRTVTDDIEIIIEKGQGGSAAPPARGHRDGDGGNAAGGGGGDAGSGAAAVPQRAYVTGMTIALAGILMFFMALTSAYIVRKGAGNDWRPLAMPPILWLNTAILIASSFTLAHARRKFRAGQEDAFRHYWGVTTILGTFFLAGQLIVWRQLVAAGTYLASNPSSSFFYVFTAAHGLHLLGGVFALMLVQFRPVHRLTRSTATEVTAMYWHFMDGLWVFLFLLLLLGR
jgi:cytochrome c oxidase subunit III